MLSTRRSTPTGPAHTPFCSTKNPDYVAQKFCRSWLRSWDAEPLDMALDLLMEDPYTKTFQVVQGMVDASVREFIADPNGTHWFGHLCL